MTATITQQRSAGSGRLSECAASIYRKLSQPEFKQEILALPQNVAERKRHWEKYKKKRWRTRLRYFGRYVARDSRLRDLEYSGLRDSHQFRSLTRKLSIRQDDEVWIVISPLRDFLKKRIEHVDIGTPYEFWDLEISGWIPDRLTEEADDLAQGFHLLTPWLRDPTTAPDIKRQHDRLEILATLVQVCETFGAGFQLLPRGEVAEALSGPYAFVVDKIRRTANESWAPLLEVHLDSIEAGKAKRSTGKRGQRPSTINDLMAGTIVKNTEAMGWNSRQWSQHLECAKSTVVETATWKKMESARLQAKAERMEDRRRKPKASDRRRD